VGAIQTIINTNICSPKRGVIEVEKTYFNILSKDIGEKDTGMNRKLVKVSVSGNLTDVEKDTLERWILSSGLNAPDFI
jgi:hypothetical protein